jgi:hypothetical protein
MPYKFNESRRHKIKKALYKVTNWAEYNDALRNRGDITIWFTQDAVDNWRPAKTGGRGRPVEYSDHAIETAMLIRQVFKLALRQTEGFMTSIARIMGAAIAIPGFSCISKRTVELPAILMTNAMKPGSVVIVDSTGLKVYGKDEWHQEKHAVPARRTWRKLHLAIDEHHQVLACELTTPEVGDPTAVVDLLAQITTPFDAFIGDGAYDGEPVAATVLSKQAQAKIIISPHKTAVRSQAGDTQRDQHIKAIVENGRITWQRETGYNLRSHVELAMQRYKRIFGGKLKARALPRQKTEAGISAFALNRMTNLGVPISVKV